MTLPASSLAPPGLAAFRTATGAGPISDMAEFHPGFCLHASPALEVSGHWASPADRLLELDVTPQESHAQTRDQTRDQTDDRAGDWIGLHLRLEAAEDLADAWIGFACRSAATKQQMIRPCLRSGTGSGTESGTETGFTDCFFDRHILTTPEPRNHLDALHVATSRAIPETAPWRELVLFLPRTGLRWDLHDLRVFRL